MRISQKLPLCLVSVLLVVVFALTAVASASAAEPWWHLTSGSNPAVLQAGQGHDEVQELAVSATEGSIALLEEEKFALAEVPWNASAKELQVALEAVYGAGNVEVTGGPGDETASKPYLITFVGEHADQPVSPMSTALSGFTLGCEGATGTGCTKTATLSVKATGRPDGKVIVAAQNLGDADVNGESSPVTVTDRLPAGVTAVDAVGNAGYINFERGKVTCNLEQTANSVTCTFEGRLAPYETLEVEIGVVLKNPSAGAENEAAVSGANIAGIASVKRPLVVGGATPFGVEDYELDAEQEGGAATTQAGSHPFQLTTTTLLNNNLPLTRPPAMDKDLNFHLPPGLLGNPTPFPQCSEQQFAKVEDFVNECPNDTAVGVATIEITTEMNGEAHFTVPVPVFNLAPSHGEPARFGFVVASVPVYLDTSVRTGGDYGVTVSVSNISQLATFLASRVSFWGVPGDPIHDNSRGWSCIDDGGYETNAEAEGLGPCKPLIEQTPPPLLSMPTSCTGSQQSVLSTDSWTEEGAFKEYELASPMPALDGCNRLPFGPEIDVAPDVPDASSPSGLTVGIHVPQGLVTNAEALSESTVRDTTVTLPEGVSVNPGGGDGLEACGESQVGYEGREAPGEDATSVFSPGLPAPFCSEASKIGTVKIATPLLPNSLTGAVYLASPAPNGEAGQNPFRTLLAMYIVAEDPVSGTLVKLPGKVLLDEKTGRLVSTFENTPQLPFEDLTLHFFGGGRAPLATPGLCGAYTTKALFTPWSGNPPVEAVSTFDITAGPNGSACPSDPKPFAPEFQSGSTNIQAGGFTELLTTMGHPDADQTLGGLSVKLPPGLSGLLSSVKLCGEAEANVGTCGPESLIGHTVVTAGLGSTPVVVKRPGDVYITGPYDGAPFGLSIVNPAEAGPFNLGNVIVRAKIEVNPTTAALTITSDPLPTIIKGIPLDIQHVQVAISKEVNGGKDFTFNPTNCSPQKIEGTISSSEGATAPISSAFQATNCASLKFAPKFSVSTSGKTSKANGASLTAKLTEPNEPLGSQANIAKVKVELPKALPSRLTTLQKACTAAQFESNPAGCPSESKIGYAKVITPLLPVPLEGPVIFVSHGGEAFPSLTMVLQGDNVTVELVGTTFISKAGITSTTFKTVPDTPFSSFELTLPEGKYSALAANGSLCVPTKTVTVKKKVKVKVHGKKKTVTRSVKEAQATTLSMPTEFVAQNGAEIHETTPVGVSGCAKTKQPKKAGSARKARRRRR